VKAVLPDQLEKMGAQMVLANTYHLFLRPGHERIERLGGLHAFMGWRGAILTDSGGFQVFSLKPLRQVDDGGVTFQSHLDGSRHRMTASLAMEIQRSLGSNVVVAFDECPPFSATREEVVRAAKRTQRWAEEGLKVSLKQHQARFGIIQGGLHEDLRWEALRHMTELPFDGFALGGLSIGEPPSMMQAMVRVMAPALPDEKPRYLMGVGRPEDLVEGVRAGVDLFDCVMPTRNARNGQLFTRHGKLNIKNTGFADDVRPLDPGCACLACQKSSRAYLRHLFKAGEVLALQLLSIHNLTFYLQLMRDLRRAILEKQFDEFAKNFYTQWNDSKTIE
jgi:queuine tRNA-ribosyltransferase